MTDDLTREHERVLLACALLGGAHTALNLLGMVCKFLCSPTPGWHALGLPYAASWPAQPAR